MAWRDVPLEGRLVCITQRKADARHPAEHPFETFRPKIPQYSTPDVLFWEISIRTCNLMLQQVKRPALVACDTMNFLDQRETTRWERPKAIDILIINDGEARAFGEGYQPGQGRQKIPGAGPETPDVKAEYGC